MDLLRFSTAGSVDDGKSTLIGRLLYDSKGVFEDQLEAVARSAVNRASVGIDLSLLTDGLRAEREQGITIDVAYRYFATPKRKFIIADTPGHEQYTRNMATGASTADLAIILIDARHGALVQSRRHTFIAALLGIRHLVVAVNKMDLVGFSQARFDEIRSEFEGFVARLGAPTATFIPLSALLGDNVVEGSAHMPWYQGPTLLDHLEAVDVQAGATRSALRFSVQYVIRPNLDFRGFAGQVAAGGVQVGDRIKCLPAGTESRVKRIHTLHGDLERAFAPQSVTVLLEDEIDVSRGDMLVHPGEEPWSRKVFDADLVWMDTAPLDPGRPYLVKHTTRTVRAKVAQIHARVDVNSLDHKPATSLQLNEIGKVRISAAQPLYLDPYAVFRTTGCFVLIDPLSNATVAAGMVGLEQPADVEAGEELPRIDRAARAAQLGHRSAVLVVRAADAHMQTAVARTLEARLFQRGVSAVLVDAEALGQVPGDAGAALPWLLERLVAFGLVAVLDLDRAAVAALTDHIDVAVGVSAAPGGVQVATDESGVDGAVRRIVLALADRGLFGAPSVVSPGAGI
ncbi:MAG: sulfate adenylyltransferase subunit CysN [Deltaproteobacteria bacterium]|nr:sulfate adenylyltransferase subunit CysN [Deltaproteobacteria bacterium]